MGAGRSITLETSHELLAKLVHEPPLGLRHGSVPLQGLRVIALLAMLASSRRFVTNTAMEERCYGFLIRLVWH